MRPGGDDRDLRDLFARLRNDDLARAPSFERLVSRGTRRRVRAPLLVAVLVPVLLIAVLVIARSWQGGFAGRGDGSNPWTVRLDPGAARWRAPTDFLLDTPGRSVLRTIPSFGVPQASAPTEAPHDETNRSSLLSRHAGERS